jgi:pimeloyl-ACP methyl ester carboxylesterase
MAWAHNTINGDCKLWYETFGDRSNPALLLVNGLGSQSINYADAWCEKFAAKGFYVLRFDNRDVGLSSDFADAPKTEFGNAYTVSDMGNDAMAVLDAEGIDKAHVMGLSMGGMIVQVLAIEHPDRLLSMTAVMTRSGEPGYGDSTPRAFELLTAPPATDRESFVQSWIDGLREWGSPEFADEVRWRGEAERAFDRSFRPTGSYRQFLAVGASGSRGDLLPHVTVPSLVMHGDKDTLITPSGGQRVAELIPGARFVLIEGMGHDYPPQLWDKWVDIVTSFCHEVAPQ